MRDNAVSRMPFLKWILLLILGTAFFGAIGYAVLWVGDLFQDSKPVLAAIYAGAGVLMLFLYLLLSSLMEGRQVDELHPGGIFPGIFKGFGTAILLLAVPAGVLFACGMLDFGSISFDWEELGFSFAFSFAVAVCVEIVFRGFLFRFLDQRWNFALGLLFSAIAFGALNYLRPGATIWSSVALAIGSGFLLGAAFKYSGSLFFPIGITWMSCFILSFLSSAGISVTGNELLTGGDAGLDSSIITVAVCLVFILIYLVKMKNSRHKEDKRIIKPLWSR